MILPFTTKRVRENDHEVRQNADAQKNIFFLNFYCKSINIYYICRKQTLKRYDCNLVG